MYVENIESWKGCYVFYDFVEMISLEVWKILVNFFEKYFFEYYNFEWEVKIKIWLILLNSLKLSIKLLFFILNEI